MQTDFSMFRSHMVGEIAAGRMMDRDDFSAMWEGESVETRARFRVLAEESNVPRTRVVTSRLAEDILAELVCGICMETMHQSAVLGCGHTFCMVCIKKWFKRKREKICPQCRQKHRGRPRSVRITDAIIERIVSTTFTDEQKRARTEAIELASGEPERKVRPKRRAYDRPVRFMPPNYVVAAAAAAAAAAAPQPQAIMPAAASAAAAAAALSPLPPPLPLQAPLLSDVLVLGQVTMLVPGYPEVHPFDRL